MSEPIHESPESPPEFPVVQKRLTEAQRRTLRAVEPLHPAMRDSLRAMTGQERLRIANGMCWHARESVSRFIARENPSWTEGQIRSELIWRMHGIRLTI